MCFNVATSSECVAKCSYGFDINKGLMYMYPTISGKLSSFYLWKLLTGYDSQIKRKFFKLMMFLELK